MCIRYRIFLNYSKVNLELAYPPITVSYEKPNKVYKYTFTLYPAQHFTHTILGVLYNSHSISELLLVDMRIATILFKPLGYVPVILPYCHSSGRADTLY